MERVGGCWGAASEKEASVSSWLWGISLVGMQTGQSPPIPRLSPLFDPPPYRSLDVLKDFAPGAQLPVLLYDGDPKTDTIKIEEFLEETLAPPE